MFNDVEKRLANYLKIQKIGEGTYGEVYEAMDTSKNLVTNLNITFAF